MDAARKVLRDTLEKAELMIDAKRTEVIKAEQQTDIERDHLQVEWQRLRAEREAMTQERDTVNRLRTALEARDAALEEEREELARLREQQIRRGSSRMSRPSAPGLILDDSRQSRLSAAASLGHGTCGESISGSRGPSTSPWWWLEACSCPGFHARRAEEEVKASRAVPENPARRQDSQPRNDDFDPGPVRAPTSLPPVPSHATISRATSYGTAYATIPEAPYVDITEPKLLPNNEYGPTPPLGFIRVSGMGGA
eukprot:CAMPEP_0197630628 /NCGR_PEP_ID=MMETSP1338-20131121/8046_1 /TAXON_ID=43686 ORGANISM="Pelagodinium beii, Strain RCC1491" /NCGR_SAMPLE_ID=MMETSP1338 /ASSEMBLY_ACC=CAM_ASM_000754 /LENGTH=253 /DNA_ID=CAMNT_0043201885 /DNA_START=45 /DNA_END=806 /DNA_ORIENTATION=+